MLTNESLDRDPRKTALEIAKNLGCSLDNLTIVADCFKSTPAVDLVQALADYQVDFNLRRLVLGNIWNAQL